MECLSNADTALVLLLRSIGCNKEAIRWCEDQGLKNHSDVQFVAEHLLPVEGSLRQFWAKMHGEPVALVADIVVVKEGNST